ncbi:MAG: hypothetical protein ACI81L_003288 [Verrucomicrobiales bacterium]
MHSRNDGESLAARIARLETELRVALERATVAEEQLCRVHIAVRTFKEKQLQARTAAIAARAAAAKETLASSASGMHRNWASTDPSLDERLDNYLQSDFEPDRSRDWMLGE